MVKNLMLYGQSGYDSNSTQNLAEFVTGLEECAVILMEDGVNGLMKPIGAEMTKENAPYHNLIQQNIPIFYLLEDVEARGGISENVIASIQSITYSELIDKIDAAERVISWL
ncbi:DsrH/TusB family sulfur relay protein [Candidatus Lokiarchaeum ossiferum]|uniref:DsrH/TusB family sulfur relay protein n=1 Tax=Candidatus Lokiarchaeum ossiferum TaxID=2951803 RepID=UPI00352FC500